MTATEKIFVAGESSERTGCQRIRLSPEDVEETLRSVPSAAGRGVFPAERHLVIRCVVLQKATAEVMP